MGCMAGQGDDGTRLLTELSLIWPRRLVVGFTTIGYRHPMHMMPHPAQDPFQLPGMRDTNIENEVLVNPHALDRLWSDLVKMPWASEYSPHAKIARNGALV
ncbi:hypothetical protein [Sorangium sp. So ce363]|uniref:hypothetical protein n=1 Tax=Sorangium sp. So ce363 TaxID=3133304 RepID=UPI003F5DBAA0